MKFKIDENLPAEFASIFREATFEAHTVTDERLSGTEDSRLFDRCREENRVLVTLDLDFANVQTYPPKSHPGVIVFRSRSQDKSTLIDLLKRLIPVLKRRSAGQELWIVERDRIRYRDA